MALKMKTAIATTDTRDGTRPHLYPVSTTLCACICLTTLASLSHNMTRLTSYQRFAIQRFELVKSTSINNPCNNLKATVHDHQPLRTLHSHYAARHRPLTETRLSANKTEATIMFLSSTLILAKYKSDVKLKLS